MVTRYELVVVIDPALTADQITTLKDKIIALVGSVVDTDDIGLLPLAYQMSGQSQAYFISWLLALHTDKVSEISRELRITKWVLKFVFYSLHPKQDYLKFADLHAMFTTIQEEEEAAKQARADAAMKERELEASADELVNGISEVDIPSTSDTQSAD
jgi:ribosomal protein S6